MHHGLKSQSGLGLIEALIAIGLAGVFAIGIMQVLGRGFRAQSSLNNSADRESIRRYLLETVRCRATLPGACTAGAAIALKRVRHDGSVEDVVPSAGRRFDKWAVIANCNDTGDGIAVRMARVRPSAPIRTGTAADFLPDPFTNKVETWASGQTLAFPTGIDFCAATNRPVVMCRKTDLIPTPVTSGSAATPYNIFFSDAECGGKRPIGTNYVCAYGSQEICGADESWTIWQPTDTRGPGVNFWYMGKCPPPPSPSKIEIVCIDKDGIY